MGAEQNSTLGRRRVGLKRAGVIVAIVLVAGLVVFAVSELNLHRVGHALITASPGWIVLALILMALSLVMRSVSWYATLRAALPGTRVRWPPVMRATMIGVMGSAVFPGRIGEPTRIVVLSRRLEGPPSRTFPIVAGTVFSQTLINLAALGILAAVTLSSVPVLQGHASALETLLAAPVFIALFVFGGPPLLHLAQRSRSSRIRGSAIALANMLRLGR